METSEQTAARPARRVGTFTFGVTLVVCGLWMLLSLLLPDADLWWMIKLSPLVLIVLGVEVLLAARKNSTIKYDWVGMLLCCLIIVTALVLFTAAWWVTRDPAGTLTLQFSGSRIGTDTGLELEYDVFRGQDMQLLELDAGDVLEAEVDNDAGAISFCLVEQADGEEIYASGELVQASFPIDIPETGAYELWVYGQGARGRSSFALTEPEAAAP